MQHQPLFEANGHTPGRSFGGLGTVQEVASAMSALFLATAFVLFPPTGRPAPGPPPTILIVGGAGGVGSIGIQIAKRHLGATVVATASRPWGLLQAPVAQRRATVEEEGWLPPTQPCL